MQPCQVGLVSSAKSEVLPEQERQRQSVCHAHCKKFASGSAEQPSGGQHPGMLRRVSGFGMCRYTRQDHARQKQILKINTLVQGGVYAAAFQPIRNAASRAWPDARRGVVNQTILALRPSTQPWAIT